MLTCLDNKWIENWRKKDKKCRKKDTTQRTPENNLSACKMRQGSACSASLGRAEV